MEYKTTVNSNNHDHHHTHTNTMFNSFLRPNYGYTNLPNDILMNPYTAPLKDDRYLVTSSDIRGVVPINVRTQGVDTNYRQLGILTRTNKHDKKRTRVFPYIFMKFRQKETKNEKIMYLGVVFCFLWKCC